MSHESPNVRKSLVFCMVEMHFVMEQSDFARYIAHFNSNQQKLVNIYIERRSGGGANSNSSPK